MVLEQWRPVVGYEDSHEVSDQGRVRHVVTARVLRGSTTGWGYRTVFLSAGLCEQTHRVHRLVLAAFVGPCPAGLETNHINGNKQDNRLGNLQWVTHSQNEKHAHATGLKRFRVKALRMGKEAS